MVERLGLVRCYRLGMIQSRFLQNRNVKTAIVVVIILTLMTWLATWEMPVDTEQLKLDSLKKETAKLQIY